MRKASICGAVAAVSLPVRTDIAAPSLGLRRAAPGPSSSHGRAPSARTAPRIAARAGRRQRDRRRAAADRRGRATPAPTSGRPGPDDALLQQRRAPAAPGRWRTAAPHSRARRTGPGLACATSIACAPGDMSMRLAPVIEISAAGSGRGRSALPRACPCACAASSRAETGCGARPSDGLGAAGGGGFLAGGLEKRAMQSRDASGGTCLPSAGRDARSANVKPLRRLASDHRRRLQAGRKPYGRGRDCPLRDRVAAPLPDAASGDA